MTTTKYCLKYVDESGDRRKVEYIPRGENEFDRREYVEDETGFGWRCIGVESVTGLQLTAESKKRIES